MTHDSFHRNRDFKAFRPLDIADNEGNARVSFLTRGSRVVELAAGLLCLPPHGVLQQQGGGLVAQ